MRFGGSDNHGLGSLYIYVSYVVPEVDHSITYPARKYFSDKGEKAIKGNLIYFTRNANAKVERQFDFFVGDESDFEVARLNQSVEAFIYCIPGAQANFRSSILGSSGSAKEAEREFLALVEDAIKNPDISEGIHRFQLAIDEAKVQFDLAVSPGT